MTIDTSAKYPCVVHASTTDNGRVVSTTAKQSRSEINHRVSVKSTIAFENLTDCNEKLEIISYDRLCCIEINKIHKNEAIAFTVFVFVTHFCIYINYMTLYMLLLYLPSPTTVRAAEGSFVAGSL